ncbi:hypothetical protein RHECNPAF_25300103 [Rhizobium etli CNPAF512]|nr:hypothetical protein RHECNPAF_25300103 [Rhizobium etli CNPAF512]
MRPRPGLCDMDASLWTSVPEIERRIGAKAE